MAYNVTNYMQYKWSQGFSTLYDLKVLNKDLIISGKIVK